MTHLQQAFFFPNDLSEIVWKSVFCEEAGCLMLFPGQDVLWAGVSAELPRLPRTGGMLIPTAASKDVRYRSLFLLHPPHPRGPLSSHHSFPSRQKALLMPFWCLPPSLALSPGGPDCTRGRKKWWPKAPPRLGWHWKPLFWLLSGVRWVGSSHRMPCAPGSVRNVSLALSQFSQQPAERLTVFLFPFHR